MVASERSSLGGSLGASLRCAVPREVHHLVPTPGSPATETWRSSFTLEEAEGQRNAVACQPPG